MKTLFLFASSLLWLGCQKPSSLVTHDAQVTTKPSAPPAPAVVAPGPSLRNARAQHAGIDWYIDSPEAALADAERSDKLVLVDLWAPWCHTCLSMREYVLTANNLGELRERLVFLALDTERPENAKWLSRWSVNTWPTLYLVDSAGDVAGRWVGAASPAQLTRFVRDSLHAADATLEGALPKDDPLALLLQGDRESAESKLREASEHYREALARAPRDWARLPESWVALAGALRKLGDRTGCVQLGLEVLSKRAAALGDTASATDFVYLVVDCAEDLPARDPRSKTLRRLSVKKLSLLCERGSPALTPDDRGDACGVVAEQNKVLGDQQAERRANQQRLRVLEAAAANVPDAVAQTYDWARSETLLQLGRGAEAVTLLQARERALPDDYNPPYSLARLDKTLGHLDEGLAAIDRALKLAYGPRRAGMLGFKADLLLQNGQRDEARAALEQQLAAYRALPDGQRLSMRESAVETRLREL